MDEKATGKRTTIDVSDTLIGIVDEFRADNPDVTIETEIPSPREILLPDQMFFEVAVTNLIGNAIDHNDAQDPWVQVGVEPVSDRIRIRIEDKGPEIAQMEREVLEKGRKHGSTTEPALVSGSRTGVLRLLVEVSLSRPGLHVETQSRWNTCRRYKQSAFFGPTD